MMAVRRHVSGVVRRGVSAAALTAALLAGTSLSIAQEADPTIDGTTGEVVQPAAPKPKPKPAAPKTAKPSAAASSEMQARINQLEEQLSDLQVVVGTLESLSKGRPRSGGGDGGGNAEATAEMDTRLREVEVRIQQLSGQLTDMSQQIRQLGAAGVAKPLQPQAPAPSADQQPAAPAEGEMIAQAPSTQLPAADGFGKTEVTREPDPIQQILENNTSGSANPDTQLASVTPAVTAEQAYEAAYGQLLQQDFAGAETGFRAFLTQNPDSPLSSEAQYFLGETHYVRGQYKQAAESYLKGYSTYRQGKRAPDSLLKLAMSLGRLGQKESACNAFTALDSEYPSAPSNVKRRAITERERIGC